MSDKPIEEMKAESASSGKDPKTRAILIALVVLWLVTLAALVGFAFKSYFDEKADKLTLAQELAVACESGSFGPGFDSDDESRLCENAQKVIDNESIPGATGPQGPQGPPGSTGLQGPRGLTGPAGERGPRGFNGATGLPGLDGQNGSDGADGADGLNGADGADGTNGMDGSPGEDGQNGAEGPAGAEGPQGPEGPIGPVGPVGPVGPPGPGGVTGVTTVGCEGPVLQNLTASYDPATQTVVITCNTGG